ncbi:MAG: class I SAM-dependent methyltransferase [Elusimicrobia bacterium]|nr:class I SAM-dependent methyltransferase [Elusimicrobiota bacterium]
MQRRTHWDRIYRTRLPGERSWTQRRPASSLALIHAARLAPDAQILDAGAGASHLADHLLKAGMRRLTLVDISAAALREVKKRLEPSGAGVQFLRADLTDCRLDQKVDLWHDRAVFHFLTRAADRKRYLGNLRRCLRPGGFLVLAAFAPTGPERCSGLPVRRYSTAGLTRELGPGFRVLRRLSEQHRKPFGGTQDFVYIMAVKKVGVRLSRRARRMSGERLQPQLEPFSEHAL